MRESFIFGGQTGLTYDQIQKQRDIANELLRANMYTPQNVGEGLSAIGRALAAKAIDKRTARADEANRAASAERRASAFGSIFGGAPSGGSAPYSSPSQPPVVFDPNSPQGVASDTMAALGKSVFTPGDRESFVSAMMPHALRVSEMTGLDPRLVIAQAAQETGWGKSAPNNNFFGIKSHGKGGGANLGTFEYVDGNRVNVNDSFRTYGNMGESAEDYARFLMENPRYKEMLAAGDLEGQLAALGRSGYATDPNYAASVGSIASSIQIPGMAPAQPAAAGGNMSMGNPATIQMIAELLADPYTPPGEKAMLEQAMAMQLQGMDPMRQLEMEKTRLELDQMRNPQPPKPIEVGGVLLDPQTYQPIFDSRQEQGPAAIVNVDNSQPAGPGADEEALRGALGKKEGEAWSTYIDSAVTSSGTMQDMQLLDELINVAPQGPIQGRLAQAFPGMNSAADAFQSVVKRVAPTLRAPGSGATSDIEYDGMLKSLPQLSSTPEANRAIAGMMRAKAEINVQRGEIVRAYQNGQLSLSDARQQISELDKRSIMSPELKGLIDGLAPAQDLDFSKMSAAELADIDINTLTPEQMDAMLKRFDEVGQ